MINCKLHSPKKTNQKGGINRMMRVKCTSRPSIFEAIDNQVTPGKFYDVLNINSYDDRTFYNIIGDDGLQIDRPADYFIRPLQSKKSKLLRGRELVNEHSKKSF
jgi:hypothetical protein